MCDALSWWSQKNGIDTCFVLCSKSASSEPEEYGPVRDWSDENIDEIIIMKWTDASTGKELDIVYRNGGPVDAAAVELLCDKVHERAMIHVIVRALLLHEMYLNEVYFT